jgi:hypothetical protein
MLSSWRGRRSDLATGREAVLLQATVFDKGVSVYNRVAYRKINLQPVARQTALCVAVAMPKTAVKPCMKSCPPGCGTPRGEEPGTVIRPTACEHTCSSSSSSSSASIACAPRAAASSARSTSSRFSTQSLRARLVMLITHHGASLELQGKIHRVDPKFAN